MSEDNKKVLGWGTIIAIMVGVGFVTGLILGLLNRFFGLSSSWAGGGVGGAMGAVGAILIAQRRATLTQQKDH